jgi:hypothetical protein
MSTPAAAKRTKDTPVWSWTFDDEEDLRAALVEYMLDETSVRIRREEGRGGGDACPLSRPEDCESCPHSAECEVELHNAQRRSEVDACMEILQHTYPFYWRLLDLYYRCGANAEVKGWITTAKRLGLRGVKCPMHVRCTMRSSADEPEDNRLELPSCQAMVALSCNWDRQTFNEQLTQGLKRLFAIHKRRRGPKPES